MSMTSSGASNHPDPPCHARRTGGIPEPNPFEGPQRLSVIAMTCELCRLGTPNGHPCLRFLMRAVAHASPANQRPRGSFLPQEIPSQLYIIDQLSVDLWGRY